MIEKLEQQLDSFNREERSAALKALWQMVQDHQIDLPDPSGHINLHCHTFFSFNSYGYSPSKFAWLAKKQGLAMGAIVDFDVLDGMDEFLAAARLLNLKAFSGMETRAFVPQFADKEINSPGEPGITYHMGVGFPTTTLSAENDTFLKSLKTTVGHRNIDLMNRVNDFLAPVVLDYEQDVLPLTPAGNAIERHLCLVYARKAKAMFSDNADLATYWSDKLGETIDIGDLPESATLLNLVRAKTMKRGGVGYVQPGEGSFPYMDRINEFVLAAGAIPTLAWLNGQTQGEQQIESLLDIAMATGVAAVNIIPDRNFTPGVDDDLVKNLYHFVKVAEERHLPIIVGTEMNSPGQKFSDDFDSEELSKLMPVFMKGAYIVYAHSVLKQQAGIGYIGEWADKTFDSVPAKNAFFEKIGQAIEPATEETLSQFSDRSTPEEILKSLK
ncbi:MAG: hypothetical protein K9M57_10225 [Phycisphaerae bacterium]|nr:hypothetical protein [Phycisphaerae bacterium]